MTPDERAVSVNGLVDRLRNDADWHRRYSAAGTLSNMVPRPRRAVIALKEALSGPNHMVRVQAAFALYHILGEDRWITYLAEYLKDPDPGVQCTSADLLGSLGGQCRNGGPRPLRGPPK